MYKYCLFSFIQFFFLLLTSYWFFVTLVKIDDRDTHKCMEWVKVKRLSNILLSRGQACVYRVQVDGLFDYLSIFWYYIYKLYTNFILIINNNKGCPLFQNSLLTLLNNTQEKNAE